MKCYWCEKTIDELNETHMKDGGYPVSNWWHVPCWNEYQDEIAANSEAEATEHHGR